MPGFEYGGISAVHARAVFAHRSVGPATDAAICSLHGRIRAVCLGAHRPVAGSDPAIACRRCCQDAGERSA